ERIVQRPVLEDRLGDVGRGAAEQDGVAVGARTRDRSGAQRRAAAALVLDHDGAEQRLDLLRPRPADGVEPAARRKRNHQPDLSGSYSGRFLRIASVMWVEEPPSRMV